MRTQSLALLPATVLLGALLLPLTWVLWQAIAAGSDAQGWLALWGDRQLVPALLRSLYSGLASAALATAISAWILSRTPQAAALAQRLHQQGWMLAVPHAAFAMGLVLLVAPSGWLLRLLSPWATGLQTPPPWPTTQDPWSLGLIAVLVCKETPFLLWAAGAHLLRPDVARRLQQELQVAATLGYGPHSAWWRIVWPQLLPRMAAPLLAVLAYSLTVVDVALVIGPATPPTLAVLAWQWLQDADALANAKGAAAAWTLAAAVGLCAAAAWACLHARPWRHWRLQGAAARAPAPHRQRWPGLTMVGIYACVLAALLFASVAGVWPFPRVLPDPWSLAAWGTVMASVDTVWATLWLGLASAALALVWSIAWLEWAPMRWRVAVQPLVYLLLALPALLWVLGVHRMALAWGLDGSAMGVCLAHCLAAMPYVLLTLQGPYTGFDARFYRVAATLGHSRWHFLVRIKWPLLRAALAAAFAVGFAVSVAQYLPTLYVGAGRISTVTTEAVALSSGGQRSLMAAFACLQCLLPAAAFWLAARMGRSRMETLAAGPGTIRA